MADGERAKPRSIFYWIVLSGALALAAITIGFSVFANAIGSLEQPVALRPADAIVVLTGGQKRLSPALMLLNEGKGKELLISGVNPSTTMDDIRRIASIKPELYECCITLDRKALDTIGNAKESVRWIRDNGFEKIILVTSNYHMPRSLIEIRRIAPNLDIQPYAVVNSDISNGRWLKSPEAFRVIALEYAKYIATRLHILSNLKSTSPDIMQASTTGVKLKG